MFLSYSLYHTSCLCLSFVELVRYRVILWQTSSAYISPYNFRLHKQTGFHFGSKRLRISVEKNTDIEFLEDGTCKNKQLNWLRNKRLYDGDATHDQLNRILRRYNKNKMDDSETWNEYIEMYSGEECTEFRTNKSGNNTISQTLWNSQMQDNKFGSTM